MAIYTVDSGEVAACSARVAAAGEQIRTEVAAMLTDLMSLEASWTGVAQVNFEACVNQWQATQTQVEAALNFITAQMSQAATVYAEAEAQSAALFAG